MWLRNLLSPRRMDTGAVAMYRQTRTDSDNGAAFIFEPLHGGAVSPLLPGYALGQGPGLPGGASPAPIVQYALVPIGAGYRQGDVYQQRLYNSRYSVGAQEAI